ncbi:MAG: PorT family protein [Bacteroidales bacterium]|nr:PorT family protein [Bacteroidales bacterium]
MKKLFLIGLIVVFVTMTNALKAQFFLGEAFVGYNLSQVTGDHRGIMEYHRSGLQAGVGVIHPVWKKNKFSMEVSLEVLFNQKGSYQGKKYHDGSVMDSTVITGEYDLRLNYGEVPLMVYFTDKNFASVGVGVSYGRLTYVRLKEQGIDITKEKRDEFNKDEFNILADVKIRVWKRLKLGFRYSYSLTPIRTIPYSEYNPNYAGEGHANEKVKQRNDLFTLRLTYVFNENLDDLQREEYRYTGDNPKFHDKAVERQLRKMKRKQAREERRKNGQ